MKIFFNIVIAIAIAFTLTSAIQKNDDNRKVITLQVVGSNPGTTVLKQSGEVISTRLKSFGINSSDVRVVQDKGQLTVSLPGSTNVNEIEGLLTSKGEISFYETYDQDEIHSIIKSGDQLYYLLKSGEEKVKSSDPRIGCTEDMMKTDDYLKSGVTVKNCKFLWGKMSEKWGNCLFALKTDDSGKPFMGKSSVQSVKSVSEKKGNDFRLQIKLNPSAAKIFADVSEKNLNKSIAIVIYNQVYAYPVVRTPINNGEVEVTGNFTKNEINYLPVVFNSPELQCDLKIVK